MVGTVNRRLFLKFLSAASALTLAACHASRIPISADDLLVQAKPIFDEGINSRYQNLPLAIDSHVHIFNASDIQAAGYWNGPIINDLNKKWRKLAKFAVPFIKLIAGFAPTAGQEIKHLNKILENGGSLSSFAAGERSSIAKSIDEHLEDVSQIMDENLNDDFWQEYIRQEKELEVNHDRVSSFSSKKYSSTVSLAEDPAKRRALIREIIGEGLGGGGKVQSFAVDPVVNEHRPAGYVAFIAYFLKYRYVNLLTYKLANGNDYDAFGIDCCFASLVNFDFWLGSEDYSRTSMADQILLMDRIAVMFDGYVLPVVGYNPWPDSHSHDESLRLVREAVEKHGFVGVKIYPSIGYKPSGNQRNQYDSRDREPVDIGQLNSNLAQFFALCRELDIPVMAHSGRSMGEYESYKDFNGPDSWAQFLSDFDYPDNVKNRIHLGHMGGNANWVTGFSNMMQKYNKANFIYGDLAFWDTTRVGNATFNALERNVNIALANGQKVIDRVMYGSDWLMMSKEKNWTSYAKDLYTILDRSQLIDKNDVKKRGQEKRYIHKIFYKNALKLYDLDRGSAGQNYARLSAYYDRNSIKPKWWVKLNNL